MKMVLKPNYVITELHTTHKNTDSPSEIISTYIFYFGFVIQNVTGSRGSYFDSA
jgi:hypothetical protein